MAMIDSSRAALERLVVLLAVALIFAVTSLLAWRDYLRSCRYLVNKTNDPASLRHAATAAKAFRAGAPMARAQAPGRLLSLRDR
jgi:hypothetical protein